MNPGSVFLSHSSRNPDFEVTVALVELLEGAGLNVWWDKDRLEGGDTFTAEIVEAIIHQYHFLFLLSGNSVQSSWCRRELARAADLGKAVLPLKLDEVPDEKMPLELAGLQYIDLRRGVGQAFPDIARALGLGLKDTYDPTSDPFARDDRLVHAIAEQLPYGNTFTDTPNLVRLLSILGQRCCETERARELFAGMLDRSNYVGSKIDYRRVAENLLKLWHGE